jgi:hypothetical protein
MKYSFELYLKTNKAEKDQWQAFYTALTAHIGYMNKCRIVVKIKDSVIRYFVMSDKDLGVLSNNIDIGVLRPVPLSELGIPHVKKAERMVFFSGNLLDLRERMKVKRGKELELVMLDARRVNAEKSIVTMNLIFRNPGGVYSVNRKRLFTFPAYLLQVNFDENSRYLKKEFPKYLNIEKPSLYFHRLRIWHYSVSTHSLILQTTTT